MRLLEIRELDGPNPYLQGPAIKIEMDLEASTPSRDWAERLASLAGEIGQPPVETSSAPAAPAARAIVATCLLAGVRIASRSIGLQSSDPAVVPGDVASRIVCAFPWTRRDVALAIADVAVEVTRQACETGPLDVEPLRTALATLATTAAEPANDDDVPDLLVIGDGPPRAVAITGTNGKTTTTRLVAHLLTQAGHSVGWSSTSGIYINGDEIESGDWSGPAGARRLLHRDDLDWAILETARGGILRRGLAWDQAHVTAMINISADHLGDYGVLTTATLAQVKGTVLRATRPDGWAVVNADDPLVFAQRLAVRARHCLFTQRPLTAELDKVVTDGRTVVSLDEGTVRIHAGDETIDLVAVTDVPLTFGGAARHMVENVLCAVGIGLGCGLRPAEIAAGLRSFTSNPSLNPGRLNVYHVRGATYLADYAHNEAGLAELIHLAQALVRDDGRLWLIIGTAGDRSDETFRALGRMAAEASRLVLPRDTPNYLRGREPGVLTAIMDEGVRSAGGRSLNLPPDEISAIDETLAGIRPGDVVAIMASDNPGGVADHLSTLSETPLA